MGIYDREYYRDSTRGSGWFSGVAPACKAILIINVVVFLILWLDREGGLLRWLYLTTPDLFQRGQIWRLVTAAFVHVDPWHLILNLLFLWIVGRDMESLHGPRDFTAMYLTAGVVGNLCWAVFTRFVMGTEGAVYGASGAVWGAVVLYTLYYPTREILLFGILPLPMWLLATLYLGLDLLHLWQQLQGRQTAPIAFAAHLGGAGYGALFKIYDLRWSRLIAAISRSRRPKFRVVRPEKYEADRDFAIGGGLAKSVSASPASRPSPTVLQSQTEEVLEARLDEILAKIAREGRASLTEEEHRVLQEASQRARAKRSDRF
jgi:membrane associated rhomboid family serine protease